MTCDGVRELLPEHLLGTLEGTEDLEVRRHLRACSGCRRELAALAEGIDSFARAAHDRQPPTGLRDRVMTILDQEWQEAEQPTPQAPRRIAWMARAAVGLLVVAALGWGASQTHRANVAAAGASSYRNLLHTLGGKEFRVGELHPKTGQPIEGTVVLYDSDLEQSWGVVLVRAPGMTGAASVSLRARDGRTVDLGTLKFQPDGNAATWLVSAGDLTPYDHVTITSADGTLLASAGIAPA